MLLKMWLDPGATPQLAGLHIPPIGYRLPTGTLTVDSISTKANNYTSWLRNSFSWHAVADICCLRQKNVIFHYFHNLPLSQKLDPRLDMMRQRRQLYALGNVLSRRFHMCSIEVKNTLFRSFCTPMYTCQLWWNFSVQSMHTLNVAYNNAFRFMHHLPTYCTASLMFVVNRVPVIVERSSGTESMDSRRDWYLLLMHLSSLRSLVMLDTVLRLFATG